MKSKLFNKSLLFVIFSFLNAGAITLDSVLARSDSCVQISWIPESLNTKPEWYIQCGVKCTGPDTVCLHSDFLPGVIYKGIAYSYGCNDPYAIFRNRLSEGKLAGSHLCHYSSCSSPCTNVTGIDCSAFICYTWDETRQSTQMIYDNKKYLHITKAEAAPGDILVSPSDHAVLIIEKDDDTNFLIHESTGTPVNGCRERMIDISNTYWNKYYAVRNPLITRSDKANNQKKLTDFPSVNGLVRNGFLIPEIASNFDKINVYSVAGKKILEISNTKNLQKSTKLPRGPLIISAIVKNEPLKVFPVVNIF
jgi:hypothetical protein